MSNNYVPGNNNKGINIYQTTRSRVTQITTQPNKGVNRIYHATKPRITRNITQLNKGMNISCNRVQGNAKRYTPRQGYEYVSNYVPEHKTLHNKARVWIYQVTKSRLTQKATQLSNDVNILSNQVPGNAKHYTTRQGYAYVKHPSPG